MPEDIAVEGNCLLLLEATAVAIHEDTVGEITVAMGNLVVGIDADEEVIGPEIDVFVGVELSDGLGGILELEQLLVATVRGWGNHPEERGAAPI